MIKLFGTRMEDDRIGLRIDAYSQHSDEARARGDDFTAEAFRLAEMMARIFKRETRDQGSTGLLLSDDDWQIVVDCTCSATPIPIRIANHADQEF